MILILLFEFKKNIFKLQIIKLALDVFIELEIQTHYKLIIMFK